MLKTSIIVVSLFGCFLLLFSLFGFLSAIHPTKLTRNIDPSAFKIKYEKVVIKTEDGITIRGWFIPAEVPNAKTILLLHGYPADKSDILPSRIFLHKKYNLLFIDFRYLGESEGSYSTFGKNEVADVLAAVNYLSTRGIHELGVWGFSMGASTALMAAQQAPQIKAIVAEAPYARLDWLGEDFYRIPVLSVPLDYLTRMWGKLFLGIDIADVSPANSVRSSTTPILLIYSKADGLITPRHGELLEQSLKNNPKVEVIVVEDIPHGRPIKDYERIVINFFEKYL